jgi:xylulokinase
VQNALVMAIDVGTTSVKCLVINQNGEKVASASNGYSIISRKPSWTEQNPEDWWRAVIFSIKECLQVVNPGHITGISFSGHMSAPVLVDETGEPVYPSILISDTRSTNQTTYLRTNYLKRFTDATGNEPLDAFTVSKLLWIKEEEPKVLKKTCKFFFPKDFIRLKLTGKMGTDPTDAGNSLLYSYENKDWDWKMIKELDFSPSLFPELVNTTELFGYVTKEAAQITGLLAGTPVITGGADMACSQIGTGATQDGIMAITLSTSGQVVTRVSNPKKVGIGKVTFHPGALEDSMYTMGSIFTGGLGVEWGYKFLNNKTEMNQSDYQELERMTEEMKQFSPGSQGLLFLPFLVGSGTPYFNPNDRAAWLGLSFHKDQALLLYSILEGITFNIVENVNVIKEMGASINKIYIGAGGSRNPVWCQMIADMLGMNVTPLVNRDGSALGAAIIAGVGVGMFSSIEKAAVKLVSTEREIPSRINYHQKYLNLFTGYQEVYQSISKYMSTYNVNESK